MQFASGLQKPLAASLISTRLTSSLLQHRRDHLHLVLPDMPS